MTERSGKCPLCEEVLPLPLLRSHIESEQKDIRAYIFEQIRVAHPKWVQQDGTCPKCWELQEALSRRETRYKSSSDLASRN